LTSKPTKLDEIDRRIIQLEMERLSLRSDYEEDEVKGKPQADLESLRLERIDSELSELKAEQEELSARWQAERSGVETVSEVKEKIAAVQLEIEQCEREFDLNRAAEFMPAIQRKCLVILSFRRKD
jgi:ATP-dependent Clp protease ATP-binding subunit ClpB